jgi:hypothetical protein
VENIIFRRPLKVILLGGYFFEKNRLNVDNYAKIIIFQKILKIFSKYDKTIV